MAPDATAPVPASGEPEVVAPASWAVGMRVRLVRRPAYLKTADPMPMLRPPDLIGVEEIGQVAELRALGQLAVRFRRGTFLLAGESLAPAPSDASSDSAAPGR